MTEKYAKGSPADLFVKTMGAALESCPGYDDVGERLKGLFDEDNTVLTSLILEMSYLSPTHRLEVTLDLIANTPGQSNEDLLSYIHSKTQQLLVPRMGY